MSRSVKSLTATAAAFLTLHTASPAYSQEGAATDPAARDPLSVPQSLPTEPGADAPDPSQEALMTTGDGESEGYFGDQPGGRLGLFGALRVGPTISLGAPHPITYGIDATYADVFGAAVTFGAFKVEIDDVTVRMDNWDVRARWFPWRSAFFVGAAYGRQKLVGEATSKIEDTETTVKLALDTTYLTPHLGWFKTWDVGFTMGFEVGYQLALASDADLSTSIDGGSEDDVKETDEYKELEDDTEEQGKKLGETNLPYITLLRLGWLF